MRKSEENKELEFWTRVFPLRLGDRVRVISVSYEDESDFIGCEGEVIRILLHTEKRPIYVLLNKPYPSRFIWMDEKHLVRIRNNRS